MAEPEPDAAQGVLVGAYDEAGRAMGQVVKFDDPSIRGGYASWLLPAADGDAWVVYSSKWGNFGGHAPSTHVVKVSTARGEVLAQRRLTMEGGAGAVALTSTGHLKALLSASSYWESTTADAQLSGACLNTSYYVLLTPAGELAYASYVPNEGFDLNAQTESVDPPKPMASCFASTAGHYPEGEVAPGKLITILGGGFGPMEAVQTTPDAEGRYPRSAAGYRVQFLGEDLPIFGVARGAITIQVPYEAMRSDPPAALEVFENDISLGAVEAKVLSYRLRIFSSGRWDDTAGMPVLTARNEDGSINSPENPAKTGSVVTLYGSGLGVLDPPLTTGAQNAADAPVSESKLRRGCWGCSEIVLLGSTPGMPSAVVQAQVRIPENAPGSGLRAHMLGVDASYSREPVTMVQPMGVVYIVSPDPE